MNPPVFGESAQGHRCFSGRRSLGLLSLGLLCQSLWGCAKPPEMRDPQDAHAVEVSAHPEPSSDEERKLLLAIEKAGEGTTASSGAAKVTLGEVYVAASGARCRKVDISGSASSDGSRLACQDDQGWFFAADVQGLLDEESQ